MTPNRMFTPLAVAAALAVPGSALAQDPGDPPPTDATPLEASITAPKTVTKAQLKKGMTVKVACSRTCNAKVSLTCRAGIVTEKSGAAGTYKLKAIKLYLDTIKKGQRVTVVVNARAADGAISNVRKDVKVK
jgi:hypothetical protein